MILDSLTRPVLLVWEYANTYRVCISLRGGLVILQWELLYKDNI